MDNFVITLRKILFPQTFFFSIKKYINLNNIIIEFMWMIHLLVIITWKFFSLLKFLSLVQFATYISSHLYNCIMSIFFFSLMMFYDHFCLYHNWAWLVSSKQLLRREAFSCATVCLHPLYILRVVRKLQRIYSYKLHSHFRMVQNYLWTCWQGRRTLRPG